MPRVAILGLVAAAVLLLDIVSKVLVVARMTPGRPATYVVTDAFLDHFDLEDARDLPGLAELRAAGLLEARPGPAAGLAPQPGADDIESGTGEAEGDLFGER